MLISSFVSAVTVTDLLSLSSLNYLKVCFIEGLKRLWNDSSATPSSHLLLRYGRKERERRIIGNHLLPPLP